MKNEWAVIVVIVAGLGAPALAIQKAGATPRTEPKNDKSFLVKAVESGLAEVELGKLAVQRASNSQVKQLGERTVADHAKANDRLQQIAATKNVMLPTALDKKDKALRDRLEKLTGQTFDQAYLTAMISDHAQDIGDCQKETTDGQDPDVTTVAAATLPMLREHLKLAEAASQTLAKSAGR